MAFQAAAYTFTDALNRSLQLVFIRRFDSEKAVFEAAALQLGLEFPVDMVWEGFALPGQLVHKGGVVRFNELVEYCLLRLIALVGGATSWPPWTPPQALRIWICRGGAHTP